jgi:hypothetical protein
LQAIGRLKNVHLCRHKCSIRGASILQHAIFLVCRFHMTLSRNVTCDAVSTVARRQLLT